MSTEDVRTRHLRECDLQPVGWFPPDGLDYCAQCGQLFPCDAVQNADALDQARRSETEMSVRLGMLQARTELAEVRIARAEALCLEQIDRHFPFRPVPFTTLSEIYAALRSEL